MPSPVQLVRAPFALELSVLASDIPEDWGHCLWKGGFGIPLWYPLPEWMYFREAILQVTPGDSIEFQLNFSLQRSVFTKKINGLEGRLWHCISLRSPQAGSDNPTPDTPASME